MRAHVAGMEWSVRRMRRRRWTPLSIAVAAAAGVIVVSLVLALLVLTAATLLLAAGVYLSYRTLRWLISGSRRRRGARTRVRRRRAAMPLDRDAAGLLEMARTADPLDRYLLAVREYDRLSGATLSLDPVELGRRRTARRAASLADQAATLQEAVEEVERDVNAIDRSSPALSGIWELSVAVRELAAYSGDLASAPHEPTLGDARRFVSRRTALLARRDALTERLRSAVIHPKLARDRLP